MAEALNYYQDLISRVAGYCRDNQGKALIVATGKALPEIVQHVAYLDLHASIEIIDVTGSDMSGKFALRVEPQFRAVLIAVDTAGIMNKVALLCADYRDSNIPVLTVMGWPPPMTARLFRSEKQLGGGMGVAAMFDVAAGYCRSGIRGDFLEFGTFQGLTLQCAYHAFNERQMAKNRRFIAFDSFAGIIGKKEGEGFADGSYACSETSFRFSNFLAEVPQDQVLTVNGAFQHTLGTDVEQTRKTLGPLEAAIVHIDCDVEVPAKLALDFVTPYLKQGSLLLFDEYDVHQASNNKGERAALRAWLKENPAFEVEPYRNYHTHARAFIVHKA